MPIDWTKQMQRYYVKVEDTPGDILHHFFSLINEKGVEVIGVLGTEIILRMPRGVAAEINEDMAAHGYEGWLTLR